MIKIILAATSVFALATVANAFEQGTDANGDGMLSPEEMSAAYADVDAALFGVIDANGDGGVSEEELASAVATGLVKVN